MQHSHSAVTISKTKPYLSELRKPLTIISQSPFGIDYELCKELQTIIDRSYPKLKISIDAKNEVLILTHEKQKSIISHNQLNWK